MTWENVFEFITVEMEPVFETLANSIVTILTAISQFDFTQIDDNKIRIAAQFVVDTIRIFNLIFGG